MKGPIVTGYTTDGQPIYDARAEEIIRRAIQGTSQADLDSERQATAAQGAGILSYEDALDQGRIADCNDPRACLVPGTKACANHKEERDAADPKNFRLKRFNPMLENDVEEGQFS